MPFDHFSLIAPLYDCQIKYSAIDTMINAAGLPTAGWLLDVGGCTGRVSSMLSGMADQIVVVDPSLGMLRFALAKVGLQVSAALSEHLPFPSDYFQRVIMVDALHHLVDQTQTAYELMRVLAPGGRLVIEEPDIRSSGVKLVAVVEKMLLMRSHFYSPTEIAAFFPPGTARIITKDNTAWVVVDK